MISFGSGDAPKQGQPQILHGHYFSSLFFIKSTFTLCSGYMVLGYMVFLVLFRLFCIWKMFSLIRNFRNMVLLAKWSIFVGPDMDHIPGTEGIG